MSLSEESAEDCLLDLLLVDTEGRFLFIEGLRPSLSELLLHKSIISGVVWIVVAMEVMTKGGQQQRG